MGEAAKNIVRTECLHCGTQLLEAVQEEKRETYFCCAGCHVVYDLIQNSGLENFYKLRPPTLVPLLGYFQSDYDTSWIAREPGFLKGDLYLRLQGVQCTACVWLIRQLTKRYEGLQVEVNAALGQLRVRFAPPGEALLAWVSEMANFGYRVAPMRGTTRSEHFGLLVRLGICAALAINAMMLTLAIYTGLDASEPQLHGLFRHLTVLFALLSMAVGGSYFIQRAWRGLRRGVLHFDLPVALGIVAAMVGSLIIYIRGGEGYFDSLAIFIMLMLGGRFLQNRLAERHRRSMESRHDLMQLRVRRISNGIEEIPFSQVRGGDRLIIPSGGIVPVNSTLLAQAGAEFALDWMTGESKPQLIKQGEMILSGGRLLGMQAVQVEALDDFSWSQLATLTQAQRAVEEESGFWQTFSRYYVGFVLVAIAGALGYWGLWRGAWVTALEVAVAVSVVTCPCSIGVAMPLARILANRRLVSRGVFVRQVQLYENLAPIRRLFFDKTGTLTLGQLKVRNPQQILELPQAEQVVLYNATARSRHPASAAVYRLLAPQGLTYEAIDVEEVPGSGLKIRTAQNTYTLGRPEEKNAGTGLSEAYRIEWRVGGKSTAQLIEFDEVYLEGSVRALNWLKNAGYELFLLSGDKKERVNATARQLGFAEDKVLGECQPADKAAVVGRYERRGNLYLGDGINDAMALQKAGVAGTPMGDQGALVAGSDFVFVAADLYWLPAMFKMARSLRWTLKFNLIFALVYNLAAIALALATLIGPLVCAILMPLSAVIVLSLTSWKISNTDLDHTGL